MSTGIKVTLSIIVILLIGLVYLFSYVPDLSDKHGVVESELYLGTSDKQPLIVAFGGGGGGNDWTRNYLKSKRDSLNNMGYALLAVGYFNTGKTPATLDRISLDAIRDEIMARSQHPKIDASKIILMGASKGGELVLNLASRYREFTGVVALSTSNVSFPSITWTANTSCWTYMNEEVPYVPAPFKTITPALKGDLYAAHAMMLEDEEAVSKAEIEVENINGPILILSGKYDDQWPATEMSERIVERLKQIDFPHYYSHIQLEGGHTAPLDHFNLIYEFLEKQLD